MPVRLRGTVGLIVESWRDSGELLFEWKIWNFFSLSTENSDYYLSEKFFFFDCYWFLSLFPNLTTEGVRLFLVRADGSPYKMSFTVAIGIKGLDGTDMTEGIEVQYNGEKKGFGSKNLIFRSDLRRQKFKLMPSDILTFKCKLRIDTPSKAKKFLSHQDASVQTDGELTEENALTAGSYYSGKQDASSQTDKINEAKVLSEDNISSNKEGSLNDIGKDIGKLLVSGEGSDTVVQVRDVEFRVHRVILSVRSPVLSAMFNHETAERASNKVSMNDCEPEVFEQFLYYIYTGSIRPLTAENVFGLYRLADKYLADDLKMQCLKHIQDTLCVDTFCSALLLALTHGESDLLKIAIEFASKNFQSILCTVEWQNFICNYPIEANEILIKCYNPRN